MEFAVPPANLPSQFGKSAAALLAAIVSATSCQRQPAPEANISGLKNVLEKSAEEQLPAPAMTDGALSLPVPPTERAEEAERINQLAMELGGGCLHTDLPNGEVSLMIQVPARAEKIFRSRLLGKPLSEIKVDPAEDSQVWIDITLRDPA